MAFWVVVPCELLLVAVPPDPLLLRAAAVPVGITNVPARINAEMVAISRDLTVTLSAPVRLDPRFRRDERKRWPKICVVASDTPRADRQTDSDRRIRRKRRGSSSRHRRSGRANCSRTSRSGHDACHRLVRDPPRRRSAGAAENGGRHCNRNKETCHICLTFSRPRHVRSIHRHLPAPRTAPCRTRAARRSR